MQNPQQCCGLRKEGLALRDSSHLVLWAAGAVLGGGGQLRWEWGQVPGEHRGAEKDSGEVPCRLSALMSLLPPGSRCTSRTGLVCAGGLLHLPGLRSGCPSAQKASLQKSATSLSSSTPASSQEAHHNLSYCLVSFYLPPSCKNPVPRDLVEAVCDHCLQGESTQRNSV